MKLASFRHQDHESFGAVVGEGIVDLGRRTGVPTLRKFLALGMHQSKPLEAETDVPLAEVELLPPVPDPAHIIGIGLNTKSHFAETQQLMKRAPGDFPPYPRLFLRAPSSQVGHAHALRIPTVSRQLDYEGEIALVIGRSARNVPRERALECLAGYACYNDGSIRDFQQHSTQVTAGKNFFQSGAFGPWLTTADEIEDPAALSLETRVNGELRQSLTMSDLIFDFGALIAYISQVFLLQPGDVIITGSPAGIGALESKWLVAGDVVEVHVPQIGTLSNPVAQDEH